MQKWNRWQDWASVLLGVILFITPFVFGVTANTMVASTAYIGGLLPMIVGLVDLSNPDNQAGQWVEGAVGVLLFIRKCGVPLPAQAGSLPPPRASHGPPSRQNRVEDERATHGAPAAEAHR